MLDAITRTTSGANADLATTPPDPAALAEQLGASPAAHASILAAIDQVSPLATPVRQGSLAALRDEVTRSAPDQGQLADPQLARSVATLLAAGGSTAPIAQAAKPKPLPMGISKLLGPNAAAIADKSPTLKAELKALEKDGWQVRYGKPGGGTFADRTSKTITIDPNGKTDPKGLVQSLAHEVGHARYHPKFDYTSSKAYLKGALGDEGEATINNIKVQREIVARGGPDIGIAGDPKNHAAYNKAYDHYLKTGDRAAARDTIGTVYGNHEHTSTTGQTYRAYYLAGYHAMYPGRK